MPLKLNGSLTVKATRDQVWSLLFDVETMKQLASKIPGIHVDALEQISEDKYEGSVTVSVAVVKGKYAGTITVVEKRVPELVRLRADGKGGSNWMNGEMALTLREENDKTLMQYEGTGNFGGMLASVGQRMIDMVGKQFIAAGMKALAEELAARSRNL